MRAGLGTFIAAAALALLPAAPAMAASSPTAAAVSGETVSQIQQAIDEQRLLDAARMLDSALLAGARDSRLAVLSGDLSLARANYGLALAGYKSAQDAPATRAAALQGQGIALSLLGRSGEALTVLQSAVVEFPAAWRAWNALGSEYDHRGRWAEAEEAYAHALAASPGEALVLNNRGYSRLLQHKRTEAVGDLVAALQKRPDFPQARTNLRLALAIGGDYDRAVAGGAPNDQAALLNNAGFAAGMRGDYAQAEDLLGRAIKAKSEYYARATENLKIVRTLAARQSAPIDAVP
jgi:Flp pilus assembly protein TadD